MEILIFRKLLRDHVIRQLCRPGAGSVCPRRWPETPRGPWPTASRDTRHRKQHGYGGKHHRAFELFQHVSLQLPAAPGRAAFLNRSRGPPPSAREPSMRAMARPRRSWSPASSATSGGGHPPLAFRSATSRLAQAQGCSPEPPAPEPPAPKLPPSSRVVYFIARCSAIGPSTATGMNISRPRMITTAHRVNP